MLSYRINLILLILKAEKFSKLIHLCYLVCELLLLNILYSEILCHVGELILPRATLPVFKKDSSVHVPFYPKYFFSS